MHVMVAGRVLASRCEAPGEAVSGFMAAGVALLLLEHPEKVPHPGRCCRQHVCQRKGVPASLWLGLELRILCRTRQVAAEAKVPMSGGAPTSCAREKTEASCGI